LAGFQVIIIGRFWVIPEGLHTIRLDTPAPGLSEGPIGSNPDLETEVLWSEASDAER
jgi:hypothetical protein